MAKLTNLRPGLSAWRTPVSAQYKNVTTRYANAKLIINAEDIGRTCMPAERDAFVEGSSFSRSMVNRGAVANLGEWPARGPASPPRADFFPRFDFLRQSAVFLRADHG